MHRLLLLAMLLVWTVPARADEICYIRWGGMDQTYQLHIPPHKEAAAPLVVVLHGGRGHARTMPKFTKFSDLADREGFLVVYPDGANSQWNDGRPPSVGGVEEFDKSIDDVGFIRAMVEEVGQKRGVDRRRIYVTGISNGAMMSHRLGVDCPDLF